MTNLYHNPYRKGEQVNLIFGRKRLNTFFILPIGTSQKSVRAVPTLIFQAGDKQLIVFRPGIWFSGPGILELNYNLVKRNSCLRFFRPKFFIPGVYLIRIVHF